METRTIATGSDHRGVELKSLVAQQLESRGVRVVDCGTMSGDSCDYPDIAHAVCGQISKGQADRGILICGSGIGMSMAANKHPEIRAALCHDRQAAEMSRRHNDANVLCLSADRMEMLNESGIAEIISTWLDTAFEGGRHQRRIDKIPVVTSSACHE